MNLKMDKTVKQSHLKRQQCHEFIELIRKEEKNIVPQLEAKIKHYFNAAFQSLTPQEMDQTQVSITQTRQILKTIVDGAKKTIEVMDRKFEQFLTLQANQMIKQSPISTSQNQFITAHVREEPCSNKMTLMADSVDSIKSIHSVTVPTQR